MYYLIDVLLFRLETPDDEGVKFKRVRKYNQTFIQYNSVFQLSVKMKGHFIDKHLNQIAYRSKKPNAFKKGISILKTNEKFKESGWVETYLDAFHIVSATRTDRDTYHRYDAVEENLQDTQKISICHQYIDTKLNLECKTFQEAIENKKYVEKECCINTLYDY